jgi:ankyrin repeat protein
MQEQKQDNTIFFEQLYTAIEMRQIPEIKKLLEQHMPEILGQYITLNYSEKYYCAISNAINIGNVEIINLLFEYQICDINYTNELETSPLIEACRFNHFDVVKLLLEKGASIETILDTSALHIACEFSSLEIVKLIVENILVSNKTHLLECKNYRGNAITLACSRDDDNIEILKFLLEKGVNFDEKIKTNAFFAACEKNRPNIFNFILETGININVQIYKETALHRAFYHKNFEIVKRLLNLGAEINIQDKNGKSVISICKFSCKTRNIYKARIFNILLFI